MFQRFKKGSRTEKKTTQKQSILLYFAQSASLSYLCSHSPTTTSCFAGINVTASSPPVVVSRRPLLAPPPLRSSRRHACHPPVLTPLCCLTPTFPPAVIKGQWQIYTHSAAQPQTPAPSATPLAFLRSGAVIWKSHIGLCMHAHTRVSVFL